MPLRDHFRPPISKRSSWQGFHALWPGVMVQQLAPKLPRGYQVEPRVNLGAYFEIDVSAYESESDFEPTGGAAPVARNGGVATLSRPVPAPSLEVEAEFPDEYSYEVLIFDQERDRRLVAAVEIVSPANKDRPDSRHLFVAKCANLLKKDVCVSIVDLVTVRHFNLYVELLQWMRRRDPVFDPNDPVPTYAATCRKANAGEKTRLETWSHPLAVGHPLPTALPIWLTEKDYVLLDLESSYEETCRPLGIA